MPQFPSQFPVYAAPNVVLFPGADLPLRIYEPRYRRMLIDILQSDKLLAVASPMDFWEEGGLPAPALHPVGTMAVVTAYHQVKNGGFNIIVHGLGKIRFGRDVRQVPYRVVETELLVEAEDDGVGPLMEKLREQILNRLYQTSWQQVVAPFPKGAMERLERADISNFISLTATLLGLSSEEKQSLLECNGNLERMEVLLRNFHGILLRHATLGDDFDGGEDGFTH